MSCAPAVSIILTHSDRFPVVCDLCREVLLALRRLNLTAELLLVDGNISPAETFWMTRSCCASQSSFLQIRSVNGYLAANPMQPVIDGLLEACGDVVLMLSARVVCSQQSLLSLVIPVLSGAADFVRGEMATTQGVTDCPLPANASFSASNDELRSGLRESWIAIRRETLVNPRRLNPNARHPAIELMTQCECEDVREIQLQPGLVCGRCEAVHNSWQPIDQRRGIVNADCVPSLPSVSDDVSTTVTDSISIATPEPPSFTAVFSSPDAGLSQHNGVTSAPDGCRSVTNDESLLCDSMAGLYLGEMTLGRSYNRPGDEGDLCNFGHLHH
ncbi:MAG: hypothetical protein KDA96_21830 [Planctomycetaceae bacterium]|nr:hypothetical protein [Planctomycetaceae bacterium]